MPLENLVLPRCFAVSFPHDTVLCNHPECLAVCIRLPSSVGLDIHLAVGIWLLGMEEDENIGRHYWYWKEECFWGCLYCCCWRQGVGLDWTSSDSDFMNVLNTACSFLRTWKNILCFTTCFVASGRLFEGCHLRRCVNWSNSLLSPHQKHDSTPTSDHLYLPPLFRFSASLIIF